VQDVEDGFLIHFDSGVSPAICDGDFFHQVENNAYRT
jgi:hypothetical protein